MKILILANNAEGLYKFRKELLVALLKENQVYISVPHAPLVNEMVAMGCIYEEIELDRHGTNPMKELMLLSSYKKLIKRIAPDVVLTYTIKPNVYGGMASASLKIPYIANVTGLGNSIVNKSLVQKIAIFLYKKGLKKANTVFFQNSANLDYMLKMGIIRNNYVLLPGSGVNISHFAYENYPKDNQKLILLVVGRLMKAKGTDEIIEAAKIFKEKSLPIEIRLLGSYDGDYRQIVENAEKEGVIKYLGHQNDVRPYIKDAHAILHASYHEGMANVLLEAAAMGRPIIATNIPGCRETFDEGISGIAFSSQSVPSLCNAVEKFLSLSAEEREKMGRLGRAKIEKEFNRKLVVNEYLKAINAIC